MREHRFTDETATILAVKAIADDMHHVLGRIAGTATALWFCLLVVALIHIAGRRWFDAGVDLAAAAAFFACGYETSKRRRKYHPTTTGRESKES